MSDDREIDTKHCGKFCPHLQGRKSFGPSCTLFNQALAKDFFDFYRRINRCEDCTKSDLTEGQEYLVEG